MWGYVDVEGGGLEPGGRVLVHEDYDPRTLGFHGDKPKPTVIIDEWRPQTGEKEGKRDVQ